MAEIRKIQEGMTGAEVADLLDGNFRGLDSDILKKSQENAAAVNTLYEVLQGVQSTLGTATTDIYELKLWASETVPGTYATKEALKGYLALTGDAQTVKGTVYFDGAYFNNVPFADVGSKSVRMATMDDVPGFMPLLDEGVEIARVDIGGQQVFLYAPKAASVDLTNYYTKEEIAKVALTGSYNDLIDKPAIPSVVDSLVSEAVADALSAKQGKVLNDAVGALRTALSLVENSYLDKTNPTVTGNMTVSGLLSAGSLSVGGRAIGSAAFYGVGNTVESGNYELITGGGVYTALQGYATTGALAGYLPTIGGTLTGALRVESMLTVTGVSEIAMLSCPKGLVVGDDQESGQAFKSFTNMFGWNGDGADLTEDWTWMIGKDGRATFGLLNATNLTLADGGVEYAGVYHDDSWGVYLWNEAAQAGLGLTDDGIPHVNGLSVLYVGNYDLYLDGVYARKATTLAGYGITDNVFYQRTHITSDENADNIVANGVYLNATGNGGGNSNFPQLYSVFLNFYQSGNYRSQLSVGTSLWFRRKIDSWESWRECLDSSNFSDYALPLSGGQMDRNTGITWNNGYYDSDAVGSHLSVLADTTQDNSLATQTGYSYNAILNVGGGGIDSYRFQLASYATSDNYLFYRGYDANANQWKNWEQIIHSGNIGSQSVSYATSAGNADTLDGLDSTWMFRLLGTNGNLNFEDNSSKNGVIFIQSGLENYHSDSSPFSYGSVLSINIDASSWMLASNNGSDLFYRNRWWSRGGGNWTPWKKIAFTDSNVASATKLATPRTIWGQSFDGSGNVSGSIYVGGLNDKLVWHNDAAHYFIQCTDMGENSEPSSLVYSSYNGHRFCTMGSKEQMRINSNGNVLIGTTTDSGYKLYVNGDGCVNGTLSVSGDITCNGRLFVGGKEIAADGSGAGFNGGTITGALRVENNIESIGMVTGKYLVASHGMQVGDGTEYEGIGFRSFTDMFGWNGNDADLTEDWRWVIRKDGAATFVTVSQGSDARMKSVIGDVRIGLADMANAPLVLFDWRNRENDKHHVGTIAQYWEAALPEVVTEAQNGMLTLAYGELGVAMGISLAKEVQELTEEVQRLRDENRALAQRLNNAGVA